MVFALRTSGAPRSSHCGSTWIDLSPRWLAWASQSGEPVRVEVEVEIWPTCMVFNKGHRIRLDIQPRDGVGSAPYTQYAAGYNSGTNTIFAGGARTSYLQLPIIPRARGA